MKKYVQFIPIIGIFIILIHVMIKPSTANYITLDGTELLSAIVQAVSFAIAIIVPVLIFI